MPKLEVEIPPGLKPHFQDYDLAQLDAAQDAYLIIQRTLEFGNWDDIRWLFTVYGGRKIRTFVRDYGQRWLRPVTFIYWRKFFRLRKWRRSLFPTPKGELWDR